VLTGITDEDAWQAVEDGWDKERILQIHNFAYIAGVFAMYVSPIGFLVKNVLFYKHGDLEDGYQGFRSNMQDPVIAYCDGSGTTANKPAGIGVVLYRENRDPVLIAKNIGNGTNNVAELTAVWEALRACPNTNTPILIKTDSQYTIGVLTNRDWTLNVNVELIQKIRTDLDLRKKNIAFEHVDGHSGIEGNETADSLAKIARKIVTKVSLY